MNDTESSAEWMEDSYMQGKVTKSPPFTGAKDGFSFRPQHPGEAEAKYQDEKERAKARYNRAKTKGKGKAVAARMHQPGLPEGREDIRYITK